MDIENYDDVDTSTQTENVETQEENSQEGVEVQGQQDQTLGDMLKDVGTGEQGNIVELVNSLGLLRNGMPFEYDSPESIKEHLMKGYDYTQKTQELAESRKQSEAEIAEMRQAFEAERETFNQERQQVQEYLIQNDVMGEILMELKGEHEEIFDYIVNAFNQRMSMHHKQLNNPEINKLKGELEQLKKGLNVNAQQAETQKIEEIRKGWENELTQVQTNFGPKLRSLGIKPDWKKVQEVWISGDKTSLSVEAALQAVHGAEILKALEAKSKLAETKAKSSIRQGPAPMGNNTQVKNHAVDPFKQAAEKFAEKYF